ncbi:MAG TPA: peptidoglycan endopeptidase [Propionibacterium sp.]|nr:peptidoglycan endopeptidase [Propionibacterium sp.]
MGSRIQQVMRAGLLGAAAATLVVTGVPAANANPDTVAKAKAEVDKLAMEAAALDQDALAAQGKLDEAQKRLATREDDVKKQTDRVAGMRVQVGQVALSQFQNRDLDPTTQLLLRVDSDTFLSQYATIQQVTANQNGALQDFQAEQANLAEMKRGAAADVETINEAAEEIKVARAASAKKLDDAEKVLARLTAEERARLQAEEERQSREAAAAAERAQAEQAAQRERTQASSRDGNRAASPAPAEPRTSASDRPAAQNPAPAAAPSGGTSSTRGLAALAFARAQIGKPYIYGGTGPSGYDCSGLTGSAWRSAGVSLPRTSQAQFGAGRPVSIDNLAPGDLVFYYSGISHVAIYAGGGQIIHASRPGKPIGYDPLRSMPIAGARQVG